MVEATCTLEAGPPVTHNAGFDLPPIGAVAAVLRDADATVVEKVRAMFDARKHSGETAVKALLDGLNSTKSTLLRHEIAYVLGQVQNDAAVQTLKELLCDAREDEMVRHEAAEALAAIGSTSAIDTISLFLSDPSGPVRETCELAIRSLEDRLKKNSDGSGNGCGHNGNNNNAAAENEGFDTVDPIVGRIGMSDDDVESLSIQLMDSSRPLWERYEAMFTLRNIGTNMASKAIADALLKDSASALFRHEAAFVLGQLQKPCTMSHLVECLSKPTEHPMARHEAALAIGSLGCLWGDTSCREVAVKALAKFLLDPDDVVRESCEVALSNLQDEDYSGGGGDGHH